jgi:integrase
MKDAKSQNKELVRLRERKLSNRNVSLYLDINENGKRHCEFLKLYLVDPNTSIDRATNKETIKLANAIKSRRLLEIQAEAHGFSNSYKLDTNFLDYFNQLTQDRINSKGNHGNWKSCFRHLEKYCNSKTTFRDVDIRFVEGFKKYLINKSKTPYDTPLSQNTQNSYFNKFKACLNQAFDDRIIRDNPGVHVKGIRAINPERQHLCLDEIKLLAKTPCKREVLKKAFLFSCLTGMRWSDIYKLTWSEVHKYGDYYRITFVQKKTKGLEYLDINDQAKKIIGEKDIADKPNDKVFKGLKYSGYTNFELQKWCWSAGVNKQITFHCGRHTFAVLQLTLGTEIYTLSRLLGHSELRTTEIYAKIVDEKKRDAVNRIPDINIEF